MIHSDHVKHCKRCQSHVISHLNNLRREEKRRYLKYKLLKRDMDLISIISQSEDISMVITINDEPEPMSWKDGEVLTTGFFDQLLISGRSEKAIDHDLTITLKRIVDKEEEEE